MLLFSLNSQSFQIDAQVITWLFTLFLLGAASYALIHLGLLFKSISDLANKSEKDLLKTLEHTKVVAGNLVDLSDDVVEYTKPNLEKTTEMVDSVASVVNAGAGLSLSALGLANNFVSALTKATTAAPDVVSTFKTVLKTVKFVKKFSSGRSFRRKK